MKGNTLDPELREYEELSFRDRYHDYLITSLRTKWGVDPELIFQRFGKKFYDHFVLNSKAFLEEGTMYHRERKIAMHPKHWLITDHILKELFMT